MLYELVEIREILKLNHERENSRSKKFEVKNRIQIQRA